jgi:DNA-binding transcriptional LysR family regulator
MDFRDLQYFEAIAELEHLGRAAKTVHRTQPALTKSVHRLEEALAVKLFERVGRGIRLTAAGEALFERARHLRVAMQDTTNQIKGYARGVEGRVRIGVAPTLAQYLLPDVLRVFLVEAPDVKLEMKIGIQPLLRERLVNGQLDLIVGPISKTSREFVTHPLVEDSVVVVAAASHPIFDKRATLKDLLDYRWVLPAASYEADTRTWLEHAFSRRGLPRPTVQVETDSTTLLPRLIAETGLLSFITRWNLGAGRVGAPLREVVLKDTTMTRQFGIVYRKESYVSPAQRRLIDLLIAEAGRKFPDGRSGESRPARPKAAGGRPSATALRAQSGASDATRIVKTRRPTQP